VPNTIGTMRLGLPSFTAIALGVCAGVLLGGCGSATKTVSVAGPPSVSQSGGASAPASGTGSATTPSGATAPSSGTPAQPYTGGTTAPEQGAASTRTAPGPAFAQSTGGEGLSAATAVLQARGFTPVDTSQYHPSQTLQVLIGSRGGSDQQAFFFVNGRYIGTDTSQPSGHVSVVEQGDTEVTLAYALYRPSDPVCCPSGGQTTVRFELNNGALEPLDPIPPAASSTGLSRQ
jgi:LppP/LprE lipoprotein